MPSVDWFHIFPLLQQINYYSWKSVALWLRASNYNAIFIVYSDVLFNSYCDICESSVSYSHFNWKKVRHSHEDSKRERRRQRAHLLDILALTLLLYWYDCNLQGELLNSPKSMFLDLWVLTLSGRMTLL